MWGGWDHKEVGASISTGNGGTLKMILSKLGAWGSREKVEGEEEDGRGVEKNV